MNDAATLLPVAIGFFGLGVALTAAAAAWFIKTQYQEAFNDGAEEIYSEVCAMQQYAYKELANEPHADIILQTLDSVVQGVNATVLDLQRRNA